MMDKELEQAITNTFAGPDPVDEIPAETGYFIDTSNIEPEPEGPKPWDNFVVQAHETLDSELKFVDLISPTSIMRDVCKSLEQMYPFLEDKEGTLENSDPETEYQYWDELYIEYEEALNNILISEDLPITFGYSPFGDGCIGLYAHSHYEEEW